MELFLTMVANKAINLHGKIMDFILLHTQKALANQLNE